MNASADKLTGADFMTLVSKCIHCGMCLQVCPTYALFDTEMDSPRGRIAMMRAAAEGRVALADLLGVFKQHIERCLDCRACESACPSGVQYGRIVETVRTVLESQRTPGMVERLVRWLGFRELMPHLGRLKWLARLLWLYEITGVQRLFRALMFMPGTLKSMEAILPPIDPRYADYRTVAPAIGEKRGEVAFFIGCLQEALLAPVNVSTIHVLQRNGYEVHFPSGQTCCGAAQLHTGDEELTRRLARQNIDAFLARDYLAVINNAGGCGATLKEEYIHLFPFDSVDAARARELAGKVKDINEFLAEHLNVLPQGKLPYRVTYSDSCHLRHGQKVIAQPRDLLKRIPGLELVELAQPERCCGSAGIYNIVQSETANAVLDMKMADIASTAADVIVTSNTGCHMQLLAGVRRAGLNARVLHITQLLDMSYQASPLQSAKQNQPGPEAGAPSNGRERGVA